MGKYCKILMWLDFNYEKIVYVLWSERRKIGWEGREI